MHNVRVLIDVNRNQGATSGADACLTRPFKSAMIIEEIESLLSGGRAQS